MTKERKTKKKTKSILIILLSVFLATMTFFEVKELVDQKNIGNEIPVADSGIIQDSIYINKTLNWTFKIPKGFKVVNNKTIEQRNRKGNEAFDNEGDHSNFNTTLLAVRNEHVDFTSGIAPKSLYPNIKTEEGYLELLDKKFRKGIPQGLSFEKQDFGKILIDSKEFSFVKYLVKGNQAVTIVLLTKIYDKWIFDLGIYYTDEKEGNSFIEELQNSKLN